MIIDNLKNLEIHLVKNIIFDWGGVITNLNFNITGEEFKKLGINNFTDHFSKLKQSDLLVDFEVNKVSPEQFRSEIKKITGTIVTDEMIDNAWMSVLRDTPKKRIDLLLKLKPKFRTFLLSNTNKIHADYYNKKLQAETGLSHPTLFEKTYYSHEIGERKPNPAIFEYVLSDGGLISGETLFIDDTKMHIEAASKVGINAYHLKPDQDIVDLFESWL